MNCLRARRPSRHTALQGATVGLLVAVGGGCSDGASAPAGATTSPVELLAAPQAEDGFQIGTEPFDVAQGVETQRCYFVEVPSDADIFVNRITLALQPGSHHLNVFRVGTMTNLQGKAGDIVVDGPCYKPSSNWADWPLVINSQLSQPGNNIADWKLPDGVAERFKAHELLMLQTHFVNTSTQKTTGVGEAAVNFYFDKTDASPMELGTIFATNQNIKACPGATNQSFQATCAFARTPVTIVAANGHFHSRGIDFTMSVSDPLNGAGAPFYESQSWDDPPFARDLNVPVPAGGGISWTCEYAVPSSACGDPNNGCCFTFGPSVETQEHCNAFAYYYPKQADINCF